MQRFKQRCTGPLDRRTWLQVGGLSVGALVNGLSPSVSDLLAIEHDGKAIDREFSVILFWANGGPSQLDLFDMKPAAPREYRGPFRPIATNVPGMEITELLPRLARLGDKMTLIRSLHHERTEHSGGTNRFLTGYPSIARNLAHSEFPEIGSVVTKKLGSAERKVPFFVANTEFYGGGPAYLGPAYAAYMPNPNPSTASGNNRYDPVPIYRTAKQANDLQVTPQGALVLERRKRLLKSLETLPRALDQSSQRLSAVDKLRRQALEMLSSDSTRRAFDLSHEAQRTRQRYGDTHWGRSLLTCRRLVEAGARFVQCQATYRLKPETGRTSNWDDHSVNSNLFQAYREKLPYFDQSVSALIEDLYARGLNERVLFVFCGEFGRTPMIRHQDPSGRPGRDHWSKAMTVLLAGGGFKMGQVIGATNSRAEEPVDRIMNSNCLLASIYRRFGIDPRESFLNTAGRPIPILTDGEPIRELF